MRPGARRPRTRSLRHRRRRLGRGHLDHDGAPVPRRPARRLRHAAELRAGVAQPVRGRSSSTTSNPTSAVGSTRMAPGCAPGRPIVRTDRNLFAPQTDTYAGTDSPLAVWRSRSSMAVVRYGETNGDVESAFTQRGARHQRDALLGHRDVGFSLSLLLVHGPRPRRARRRDAPRSSPSQPASACSRVRCSTSRRSSSRATPTWCTGARSPRAATSPRASNRRCSWRISARFARKVRIRRDDASRSPLRGGVPGARMGGSRRRRRGCRPHRRRRYRRGAGRSARRRSARGPAPARRRGARRLERPVGRSGPRERGHRTDRRRARSARRGGGARRARRARVDRPPRRSAVPHRRRALPGLARTPRPSPRSISGSW